MKVFHLYSSFTPGGAERRILSLAKSLNEIGVQNTILSPKGGFLCREAERLGIERHPLNIRNSLDPFGIFSLFIAVKRREPDILHIHQGKIFWPAIFVKRLFGNRLKLVFHRRLDKKSSFFSRGHYRFADRIIAVSKRVAKNLIELDKVNPSKVSVVYNGIEIEEEPEPERVIEMYGLRGKVVIGAVGGMSKPEGKGQRYLLEAARLLREDYTNLHYLIVGDGSIKNELERYSQKIGVSDIVTFCGYQERVYDFIGAMEIVCLLSCRTDALPAVLIEAQLLGKPVIGTDIGGIPETFVDGVSGFLIRPRDVEGLRQHLAELIEDEKKRKVMGSAGKELAEDRFSVKKCCEQIKSVYESLL
jgi:glycosyltransferase involved in cell wall biosynthesis